MSLVAFVQILFLLVMGLVACTGIALLVDHWRTRKLHRNVRAYEGLGDGDWLSLRVPDATPEQASGEEAGRDQKPAGPS